MIKQVFLLKMILLSSIVFAQGLDENQLPPEKQKTPKILVLDPVDLENDSNNILVGANIREIFENTKYWEVLTRDEMRKKFDDYNKDLNVPCKEFLCSHDAGGFCQTDYVLFGTISLIDNLYIFNINLIDVQSAKVVWTEVGEVLIKSQGNATEALTHKLRTLISGLNPSKIINQETKSIGILGILDVSEKSEQAKVLLDRLNTHAYTSGLYDVMDQSEFNFLFEALNIQKSTLVPDEPTLLPLGDQLGVNHLIYSKLDIEDGDYKLILSLFDIQKRRMVRNWPFRNNDFRKILRFEEKFFSNLLNETLTPPKAIGRSSSKGFPWKWVAIPAFVLGSGVFAVMAYNQNEKANDEFDKFNSADSWEARNDHKTKGKFAEKMRTFYGGLSGIMGGATVGVVIAF